MLEVRDLLGEPEDVSTKRNPQIWKYGSLELTFYTPFKTEEPRLASFTIQFHLPTVKLPESLPLSDRLPTSEMSLEEFRELLLDVPVHVDGGVTSGPIQHLVLGSGVRVSFDDGRLYNLTCTMRREPELKQISIAIPRRVLNMIQVQALASRESVSELCARWLEERVANLPAVVEVRSGAVPSLTDKRGIHVGHED